MDKHISSQSPRAKQQQYRRQSQACRFLLCHLLRMGPIGQPSKSAAQRRRERRLRSLLRHEWMIVAMVLAESTHHSSRGQRNAIAGVWGREMNFTATIRDPPHTPAGALQPLCRRARRYPGQTGLLLCRGRRSGICGAPCSRLSMQSLRCRFSTILLRRW